MLLSYRTLSLAVTMGLLIQSPLFGDGRANTASPLLLSENGQPIVEVRLHSLKTPNQSRSFRFLLDTGCTACAVDSSVPKEFYWDDPDALRNRILDATGQRAELPQVFLKRVEIGGFVRDGIAAFPMDLKGGMPGRCMDEPVDGILGMSFLRGTRLMINAKAGRVEWWPALPKPSTTLRLRYDRAGIPVLALKSGKGEAEVEVDTGNTGGITLPSRLRPSGSGERSISTGLHGGSIAGVELEVPRLEGGPASWTNVKADFEGDQARLGMEVWAAVPVCFDFVGGHISFHQEPEKPLPILARPRRPLPLAWDRDPSGAKLTVLLVKPGSAMDKAGCRPGDEILRAGSLEGPSLTRRAVQDLVAAGEAHAWIVKRKDREVRLNMNVPNP